MDDATKFQAVFIDNATEWLTLLENTLCRFEHTPNDKDLLNDIFRTVHSIKGTSGTVGFENIYLFAHSVEELLYLMRQDNLAPEKKIIDVLFGAIDIMLEMLEAHAVKASFDFGRCENWMAEAEKIKSNVKVFKHG